jgi:3-oxoacyl-[acyl-carrier protein] reductase
MLVTGSGRNIGRAIILEFAARGANVVVNARSNREEAESVKKEAEALGAKAIVVLGDASQPETIERLKTESERHFGRVDMYVSNANSRLYKESFFDTTNDDWHFYLNQHLTASWYLAKALVPGMQTGNWGRIIHINGPSGWKGAWGSAPIAVGKGGLRTLTKSLAAGLGQYGITVNDVNPGYVDVMRDPGSNWDDSADARKRAAEKLPIRRLIQPEEIAWACVYLCAPRSGAITGTVIHVDGGPQVIH